MVLWTNPYNSVLVTNNRKYLLGFPTILMPILIVSFQEAIEINHLLFYMNIVGIIFELLKAALNKVPESE